MKKLLRILAAACLLAGATATAAAEEPLPTLGFGLRAEVPSSNSNGVGAPGTWLCVPIRLGAFRIEPEVGLSFSRSHLGTGTQVEARSIGAALGAFYQFARTAHSSAYLGGRLGLSRTSESSWSSVSATRAASAAAVAGVEFFPSPSVSLGAEGQARLGESSNDKANSWLLARELVGAIAVRFYVR